MSESANVVARWRERGLALGRKGWACPACGKLALVRRRLCTGCGSTEAMAPAPLAPRGVVRAASLAGAAVEHLDQVTSRKAAVWVELDGGGQLSCLIGHADSVSLFGELRGQPVRLAVRKMELGEGHGAAPLHYGLKVALDLDTRIVLKSRVEAARAAKQSKDVKET